MKHFLGMLTLFLAAGMTHAQFVNQAAEVPAFHPARPAAGAKLPPVLTEKQLNDQGLILLAQRRGAGEVEVHEKTNHVFIIVEGEATFVTGGTLVDARQTGPDQRRAPSVQGGQIHHLTKGDVITIPAKTPHWFKEVPTQTIAYYAVNIEN